MTQDVWARNDGIYLGYACENTIGEPEGRSVDPVQYVGDRHIITFGPNGSGKSRRLLWPNLIGLIDWSILVIDPKGEMARDSAALRENNGSKILLLNPFDVMGLGTDTFNPVAALDKFSRDLADDAMGLAEALVIESGKDPHWAASAQDLICALILYSRLKEEFNGGSLAHVRSLLGKSSTEFVEVAKDMQAVAIQYTCEELGIKAARWRDMEPDNRELTSIFSTALTNTRWLDSMPIKSFLAEGEIDFSAMKRERWTVYLILPPNRIGTHGGWLRLMLTAVIQGLMRSIEDSYVPVLLMLDEFAALGHVKIIRDNMAMMRGYGIKMWALFQDLPQAQDVYSERWESFIANAGVLQAFAPQDLTTASFLSARAGTRTENVLTFAGNVVGTTGRMQNLDAKVTVRELPRMRADEIINMDMGYSVLFTHKTKGVVLSFLDDPTNFPGFEYVAYKYGGA